MNEAQRQFVRWIHSDPDAVYKAQDAIERIALNERQRRFEYKAKFDPVRKRALSKLICMSDDEIQKLGGKFVYTEGNRTVTITIH